MSDVYTKLLNSDQSSPISGALTADSAGSEQKKSEQSSIIDSAKKSI